MEDRGDDRDRDATVLVVGQPHPAVPAGWAPSAGWHVHGGLWRIVVATDDEAEQQAWATGRLTVGVIIDTPVTWLVVRTTVGIYDLPQGNVPTSPLAVDDTLPPAAPESRQVIHVEVVDDDAMVVALRTFTLSPAVSRAALTGLRRAAALPALTDDQLRAAVQAGHRRWPGPTDTWRATSVRCRAGE